MISFDRRGRRVCCDSTQSPTCTFCVKASFKNAVVERQPNRSGQFSSLHDHDPPFFLGRIGSVWTGRRRVSAEWGHSPHSKHCHALFEGKVARTPYLFQRSLNWPNLSTKYPQVIYLKNRCDSVLLYQGPQYKTSLQSLVIWESLDYSLFPASTEDPVRQLSKKEDWINLPSLTF